MAHLNWTDRATRNLESIGEFIGQHSIRAARRVVKEIRAKARTIPAQPYLGALVLEYDDEMIRERQIYDYRIIYEIRGDEIDVLLVWHGARPLPADPHG